MRLFLVWSLYKTLLLQSYPTPQPFHSEAPVSHVLALPPNAFLSLSHGRASVRHLNMSTQMKK